MPWEYRTVRLERPEGYASWDQEAAAYSKQLSEVALEGWEVCHWQLPWVVFRRAVPISYPEADTFTPEGAGTNAPKRGTKQ